MLLTKPNECVMAAEKGTGDISSTNCDYIMLVVAASRHLTVLSERRSIRRWGVWVTQIEAGGIKVRHFTTSAVPANIQSDRPDLSK